MTQDDETKMITTVYAVVNAEAEAVFDQAFNLGPRKPRQTREQLLRQLRLVQVVQVVDGREVGRFLPDPVRSDEEVRS